MNRGAGGGKGSLIIIQLEMVSFPPVLLPKMARKTLNSPTSIWCPEPLRGKDRFLTFEAKLAWRNHTPSAPAPSRQIRVPARSQVPCYMLSNEQSRYGPCLPTAFTPGKRWITHKKNIGKLQPVSQVLGRRCARW